MVTSVDVFKVIKELSKRTFNPDPRVLLSDIATELSISQDSLLVLLVELKDRGLIKLFNTPVASVNLTNYGVKEDDPPGGFRS